MTAIAICKDDQIAAARVLGKYAKAHDNYVIKAGCIDGKLTSAEEIKVLSELPSKEILIATVLGTLNAPITGLAVALKAIADKKEA